MSDLISRQAAIDAYGDWYVEEGTAEGFIGTVKQLLEGLPSAEPVRHGKWILERRFTFDSMHSYIQYQCTCCGRYYVTKTDYCPNCGARMDEE